MSTWLGSAKYEIIFLNFCHLGQITTPQNFTLSYRILAWGLCWTRDNFNEKLTIDNYARQLNIVMGCGLWTMGDQLLSGFL